MSIEDFLHPLWKRSLELDKNNLNTAMLHEIQKPLSQAEQDIIASRIQLSVDTATSYWLDYWGSWLGLHRINGWTDDEYREHLKHHVLHPRNTIAALQQAVADFLNTDKANIHIYEPFRDMLIWNKSNYNSFAYFPSTYYRYAVIDVQIDAPYDKTVAEIINLFRPAGVIWVITSKINSYNTNAPILQGIANGVNPMQANDINYSGFETRDTNRLVAKLDSSITVNDPFIYNDKDSLLNSGKEYYGTNSRFVNVASVGQIARDYTPLSTDTFEDTRPYVEQLDNASNSLTSDRNGYGKLFNLQPSKLNLLKGTTGTTTITQGSPNILQDISSSSAVGTNLALGTSSDWQKVSIPSGWGTTRLSNPVYEIKDGETYTLQVEVRNITSPIMLEAFNFTAAGAGTGVLAPKAYASDDTKIIVTFTAKLPEGYAYFQPDLAFVKPLTSTGSYEFRRFKIERGNKATDWTPVPEDLVSSSIGYQGYVLQDNIISGNKYQIGLTGVSTKDISSSSVKIQLNGVSTTDGSSNPISQVLQSGISTKSTWLTNVFEIPDNWESDNNLLISLEGTDTSSNFSYNNIVVRKYESSRPLYYSFNVDDSQNDYGITGIFDIKSYLNTYHGALSSNTTNSDINNMFSTKNIVVVAKNQATTVNSEFEAKIYNFNLNMWVSLGDIVVTPKYQDYIFSLNDITPYMNNNGIVFIKLEGNKSSYISIDYMGLTLSQKENVPDSRYIPNQTGSGAETSDGGGELVNPNLLTGTSSDLIVDDSSNASGGYKYATVYSNLVAGTIYTFSSDVSVVGTATSIDVRVYSRTTGHSLNDSYTTFSIVDGKISGLVKPTEGYTDLIVYAGNAGNTQGNKVTFHHMKLEQGTTATPWTPYY